MRKEDDVRLLAAALAKYYEQTRNQSEKRMFGLGVDVLRWVLEYPTESGRPIGRLFEIATLNEALGQVLDEEQKKKKLAPKPPPNCA